MVKNKYDSKIGRNVIKDGEIVCGIAYKDARPSGRVKEKYNPRNGRFELVDQSGQTVGFVPKNWR